MTIGALSSLLPHIHSGRLRALGTGGGPNPGSAQRALDRRRRSGTARLRHGVLVWRARTGRNAGADHCAPEHGDQPHHTKSAGRQGKARPRRAGAGGNYPELWRCASRPSCSNTPRSPGRRASRPSERGVVEPAGRGRAADPEAGQGDSEYVSGAEAAAILGVKPQTLYTYVSRGAIQSCRPPKAVGVSTSGRTWRAPFAPAGPYSARCARRIGVAAGDPIIPTSITEITRPALAIAGGLLLDWQAPGCRLRTRGVPLDRRAARRWPVTWKLEPLPAQVHRLALALGRSRANTPIAHLFSLFALSISMARGSPSERLRSSSTLPRRAR